MGVGPQQAPHTTCQRRMQMASHAVVVCCVKQWAVRTRPRGEQGDASIDRAPHQGLIRLLPSFTTDMASAAQEEPTKAACGKDFTVVLTKARKAPPRHTTPHPSERAKPFHPRLSSAVSPSSLLSGQRGGVLRRQRQRPAGPRPLLLRPKQPNDTCRAPPPPWGQNRPGRLRRSPHGALGRARGSLADGRRLQGPAWFVGSRRRCTSRPASRPVRRSSLRGGLNLFKAIIDLP